MLRQLKSTAAIPLKAFIGLLTITVLVVFISLIVLPIVLYRRFLFYSSKVFRPDFDKMVNAAGTAFAFENVYESPKCKLIGGVTLEGSPSKQEIVGRFKSALKVMDKSNAELLYPEMQQEMVCWGGYRFWRNIPNFSIEDYITIINDSTYTFDQGIQEIRNQSMLPYEKGKALWNLTVFSKYKVNEDASYYDAGKVYSLMIFSCHHSLCDGFSLLNLFKSIAEPEAQMNAVNRSIISSSSKTKLETIQEVFNLVSRIPYDIGHSLLTTNRTSGIWNKKDYPENRFLQKQRNTQVNQFGFGTSELMDFSRVKDASRLHQVSTISVIAACICGSVKNSISFHSSKIPEAINFAFPIPLPNHPSKLRNHVTNITISAPLSEPDPLVRLAKIDRNIKQRKSSTTPVFTYFMNLLLASFPPVLLKLVVFNIVKRQELVGLSSFPGPPRNNIQMFPDCYMKDGVWMTSGASNTNCLCFGFTTYCGNARLSTFADYSVLGSDKVADNLMTGFLKELNFLLQNAPVKHEEMV